MKLHASASPAKSPGALNRFQKTWRLAKLLRRTEELNVVQCARRDGAACVREQRQGRAGRRVWKGEERREKSEERRSKSEEGEESTEKGAPGEGRVESERVWKGQVTTLCCSSEFSDCLTARCHLCAFWSHALDHHDPP